MKHQGRGVIRLNDKSDHGGQVISATLASLLYSIVQIAKTAKWE